MRRTVERLRPAIRAFQALDGFHQVNVSATQTSGPITRGVQMVPGGCVVYFQILARPRSRTARRLVRTLKHAGYSFGGSPPDEVMMERWLETTSELERELARLPTLTTDVSSKKRRPKRIPKRRRRSAIAKWRAAYVAIAGAPVSWDGCAAGFARTSPDVTAWALFANGKMRFVAVVHRGKGRRATVEHLKSLGALVRYSRTSTSLGGIVR